MQVNLDTKAQERILGLAARRSRPADFLAQEAVEQYLDREEARLTMQEDGIAAWSAYQSDGLHLTAEEADEWLASLEAGDDIDPPACHS